MSSHRAAGTWAVLVVAVALLTACAGASEPNTASALGDDAITVGSFEFAENELLAEIYSQALEAGGYDVERAFNIGPREFVAPAFGQGLIEFLPEYAGTALQFLTLGAATPTADVDATHDALVEAAAPYPVTVLRPAPAQNANAFVVSRETAERRDLERLSDLTDIAAELTFGGPPECPTRPLCLVGLQAVYGLEFATFVRLDTGGPATRQALDDGLVDIALLFTTDPAIDDYVVLVDDLELQPAENVTPLIRTEVVDRWSGVTEVVDTVSRHLTTDGLRELNAALASGTPVVVIAARWLGEEGLR